MDDTTKENGSNQSKVVPKEKRAYFLREWTRLDVMKASFVVVVHVLCLLVPFNYKLEALLFGVIVTAVIHLGVTFSYHRNLTHRSFKLPKWLEYPFAYIAIFALQCGRRSNVMDLKQQWFYRFLANTIVFHFLTFWTFVYFWGGLPYLCGLGFGGVIGYHGTWLINSICHSWGSKAWNSKDTSRNVWWLALLTNGESWHNNHHAFETSARHGLEWYQVDLTWYLIRFFQVLGLATNVKLPSDAQKRKMALAH